jgi:hypothetical protein
VNIEPYTVYSGMWRARHPDSTITDMVDLTRAKDAATEITLNILKAQETAHRAPPVSFFVSAVCPAAPQRRTREQGPYTAA